MRPFDNITRAEAVIMLARAFSIAEYADGIRIYDDAGDIRIGRPVLSAPWLMQITSRLKTRFNMTQDITRAEIVLILDRLLTEVIQNSGVYTDNIHGNVLVTAPDVVFSDLTQLPVMSMSPDRPRVLHSPVRRCLEKSII